MFTDNPTIPAQLEVLLDVVHKMHDRKANMEALKKIIQPKGLPGVSENSRHLELHISAALELGLLKQDENENYRVVTKPKGNKNSKSLVLDAFDRFVLSETKTEKWCARFYSYLIVQDRDVGPNNSKDQELFSKAFMENLPITIERDNPMNSTKYSALIRWYCYSGMGWINPAGSFIPDPTLRLRRALPTIWGAEKKLDADLFMSRLAKICPELDGGGIFQEITSAYYNSSEKKCTRALAIALWNLHDLKEIRLHCPNDNPGWLLDLGGEGRVQGEMSNRVVLFEKLTKVNA